jgi:CheY-like chemotaxis protein/phosphoribosyl 1,2-cyclic phosphodiesterase
MKIRFWGTRGSIARPGPATVRYGGNTSCVEVRADDGTILVLDSGTGAHELGAALCRAGAPERGHMLIGHTHWDHIQGFPFFAPFFESEGEWDVYAPGRRAQQLEDTFAGQMSYDYHPITVDAFKARVRFHDLREGSFRCESFRVVCRYLHHPALTLGYRLEADGATLVYSTDHEPHSVLPLDAEPGAIPIHHEDQRHVAFLADADLLIHDSQYLLDEFPLKAGWGHTPIERAVDYAIAARAKRLALFHHDPMREDDAVDRILEMARERAARGSHVPEVFAAAEGEEIELLRSDSQGREPFEARQSALLTTEPQPATVLIVEDDPEMTVLLKQALEAEGVRLIEVHDGESALKRAREDYPSLVLLELKTPAIDGLEVCRRLRADADPDLRNAPILILTGALPAEEKMVEAFLAGATDYLIKPIRPTLVRTRVRGWLLRQVG